MKDRPKDPDIKTKWAEDRTDWAEDRTVLANERTFAGWLRTALAAVAVALGLHAVFGELQPTWAPKGVASVFILIACLIAVSAAWRARENDRRMREHATRSQRTWTMLLMAVLVVAGALASGAVLWLL